MEDGGGGVDQEPPDFSEVGEANWEDIPLEEDGREARIDASREEDKEETKNYQTKGHTTGQAQLRVVLRAGQSIKPGDQNANHHQVLTWMPALD